MAFSENAPRHGQHSAQQRLDFFKAPKIIEGRGVVERRSEGFLMFFAMGTDLWTIHWIGLVRDLGCFTELLH